MRVFVATGGHAFARDAFEEMLRAVGIVPTFVDQPAAAMLMNPDAMRGYDALLLYDMPGLDFASPVESRPEPVAPPPEFVNGFRALLDEGKGIVALHHAIAGWPGWPAYAETLGGAFLYRPAIVRGVQRPGSGYVPQARLAVITAPPHPVLEGVPQRFEIEDEPYLFEVFDDVVEPLLRRDPIAGPFHSASHAVRRIDDERDWVAPADCRVIGWVKAAGNSPLVYLQPGDGPAAFANPAYRTLVGNALRWVASPVARAWLDERRHGRDHHPSTGMASSIDHSAAAAPTGAEYD